MPLLNYFSEKEVLAFDGHTVDRLKGHHSKPYKMGHVGVDSSNDLRQLVSPFHSKHVKDYGIATKA